MGKEKQGKGGGARKYGRRLRKRPHAYKGKVRERRKARGVERWGVMDSARYPGLVWEGVVNRS